MLGAKGNDRIYGDHHPRANKRSGGGRTTLGAATETTPSRGGPKRDKCSGGPGRNDFVRGGPQRCEVTTGNNK